MRDIAEPILREVESAAGIARSRQLLIASIGADLTGLQGISPTARASLRTRAQRFSIRERDRDLSVSFCPGHSASPSRPTWRWYCGRLAKSIRRERLIEEALARAMQIGHVATVGYAHFHFARIRNDAAVMPPARLPACRSSRRTLARQHEMPMFDGVRQPCARGCGAAAIGDRDAGIAENARRRSRLAATRVTEHSCRLSNGAGRGGSARPRRVERRLRPSTTPWPMAERNWTSTGSMPKLHRIRGEILLKRDPANTAPAEEAFLTAIAIAQQQKARSFELRAALSLAKLYQSTGRPADAHAVLAPALEGFSPTPEFPEIEEAQALLAALAETDEVKNAAAAAAAPVKTADQPTAMRCCMRAAWRRPRRKPLSPRRAS